MRLLVRRYERARLIVPYKSFGDWGEVIKGESYRLKQNRAGLLGHKPKSAEPEEADVQE